MKRIISAICAFIILNVTAYSQSTSYMSYSGEMIFSFANIEDQGRNESSLLRWTPVLNFQGMYNIDMNRQIGLFTGLAVRNVGYNYDNYTDLQTLVISKKKFRTYNLAIPVGFKIGNLDNLFLFAGYEIEFPFHYKEKTFDGGDKISKTSEWFSKRNEPIQHGILAGIQFQGGPTIKFKYYLSEFHNQGYMDAAGNKSYDGLAANIFYFSLNYYLFTKVNYSSSL